MRIVASYSLKGGVGKTCTAVNLAYVAAQAGQRTLLWDLDPQAAATWLFRIKPRVRGGGKALIGGRRPLLDAVKGTDYDDLDLLPADFTYRNMDLLLDGAKRSGQGLGRLLDTLAGEYDVVLLDCPPNVSLLSENVLAAADTVLIPLIPTTLSLRTLDQLIDFVAGLPGRSPSMLAFFSMVDRRKSLHRQIVAETPRQRPTISEVSIPAASIVEQMAVRREPLPAYAVGSPIARSYRDLWQEVIDAKA